jgi:cytochrome c oxidase cbb3-type subunit III
MRPLPSPSPPAAATLLALLLVGVLASCRVDDPWAEYVTHQEDYRDAVPRLIPGPAPGDPSAYRPRPMPIHNPYEGDRTAIRDGRRLYRWMNCDGCHAEGGGSIGPALWDEQWRYGGRGIDIAESILFGRPDGMPAYAGHLPEEFVWRIVAYVQSMEPRGGPYNFGVK